MTLVPRTLPVTLPDLSEWADHAIQGKATVPAALLLDLLIKTAGEHESLISADGPLVMRDAVFSRFLPADEIERCTFDIALEELATEGAGTRAILSSRIGLAGGMRRTRMHAAVTLGGTAKASALPSLTTNFMISAERAYSELIPFGPRYRHLRGDIHLGQEGATARVVSPEPAFPDPSRAGSPHLFDGAMHLACLWGQRYAGVVAYPTGFSSRVIASPVAHGQRRCVVTPKAMGESLLAFDLWLTDDNHRVCDSITDLTMLPLANGRKPAAP